MSTREFFGQLAFGSIIALLGLWSFRRGMKHLRRDWRTASPWLDRLVARAIAPASPPPKSIVDHVLTRTSQTLQVAGGVIMSLIGFGFIIYRITTILPE